MRITFNTNIHAISYNQTTPIMVQLIAGIKNPNAQMNTAINCVEKTEVNNMVDGKGFIKKNDRCLEINNNKCPATINCKNKIWRFREIFNSQNQAR